MTQVQSRVCPSNSYHESRPKDSNSMPSQHDPPTPHASRTTCSGLLVVSPSGTSQMACVCLKGPWSKLLKDYGPNRTRTPPVRFHGRVPSKRGACLPFAQVAGGTVFVNHALGVLEDEALCVVGPCWLCARAEFRFGRYSPIHHGTS